MTIYPTRSIESKTDLLQLAKASSGWETADYPKYRTPKIYVFGELEELPKGVKLVCPGIYFTGDLHNKNDGKLEFSLDRMILFTEGFIQDGTRQSRLGTTGCDGLISNVEKAKVLLNSLKKLKAYCDKKKIPTGTAQTKKEFKLQKNQKYRAKHGW